MFASATLTTSLKNINTQECLRETGEEGIVKASNFYTIRV